MIDRVINQARIWGFSCEQSDRNWQIFPRDKHKHWFLEQSEDRWVLSIRSVPQICFHSSEAIAFLELRYNAFQKDKKRGNNKDEIEE